MNEKYLLNTYESPIDYRDYSLDTIIDTAHLPHIYDMRKDMWRVRNQGSQGSCAAHVGACIKEWQEKKDINFAGIGMSAQFIYNLRKNKKISGMCPREVMKILKNKGIVRESDYPYLTRKKIDKKLLSLAKNFVISGYAKVNTINELKYALYRHGPCYISVPVFHHENIKIWKRTKPSQKRLGGHGMTIVGYTRKGFILRNSWGVLWGNDGYCIFPYEDWGCQCEIWSAIDARTTKILQPKEKRKEQPLKKIIILFNNILKGKSIK